MYLFTFTPLPQARLNISWPMFVSEIVLNQATETGCSETGGSETGKILALSFVRNQLLGTYIGYSKCLILPIGELRP